MVTIIQKPKRSPERVVTLTYVWIINHRIDMKKLTNTPPNEVTTNMDRSKKTTILHRSKDVANL